MKSLEEVERDLPYVGENTYPQNGFFTGPERPCRFEAEVYNCTVRGQIPRQIDGTYYRVCIPKFQRRPGTVLTANPYR